MQAPHRVPKVKAGLVRIGRNDQPVASHNHGSVSEPLAFEIRAPSSIKLEHRLMARGQVEQRYSRSLGRSTGTFPKSIDVVDSLRFDVHWNIVVWQHKVDSAVADLYWVTHQGQGSRPFKDLTGL